MLKAIETDLQDAADALEHLLARLPKLTREEKVDIAARLRGPAKTIKAIDEVVKDEIKRARKGREGTVLGEMFKAIMTLVPTTRLDTTKVKVEHPEVYDTCLDVSDVTRITFEIR